MLNIVGKITLEQTGMVLRKPVRKRTKIKNRLLTVKLFLSLLKYFIFKIGIRGNPLRVKGLSFQIMSSYCQSIYFGLQMKYNFEVKRKKGMI